MVISNTRNVARMGDPFFYGTSVAKLDRLRLHDTGADGKKIKRSLQNDGTDID
jgi:hypothetical protein